MAKLRTLPTDAPKPGIKVSNPPWPANGPALAISFSGGGFRASLAGIGLLRALADNGLLANVRYSSSVSGGSWANALLARNWHALAQRDHDLAAVDELIVRPFVDRITTTSLTTKMALNLWRVAGPKTRTDLLADAFDDWFGHGMTLGELPADCRWIFNATNLSNGVRFGFERERIGDYRSHYIRAPEMRLADALAASAAIPGALATQHLRSPYNLYPRRGRPKLVDGAVYDNLGIEPLLNIRTKPLIVVLDSGARLKPTLTERLGLVGSVKRAQAVINSQPTILRKRWLVDKLRTWEDWEAADPEGYATYIADQRAGEAAIKEWQHRVRAGEVGPDESPPPMPPPRAVRGIVFGLATSMDPKDGNIESAASRHQTYSPDPAVPEVPPWHPAATDAAEWRAAVAGVPMSAGKFEPEICRDLIYRGWWLARESLRTFHPETLSRPAPAWSAFD